MAIENQDVNTLKPIIPFQITRNDDHPQGRHYNVIENSYDEYELISTTNFLSHMLPEGSWLNEWRERIGNQEADKIIHRACFRGDHMHYLCEMYLKGQEYNKKIMPLGQYLFNNIKKYIDRNISKVIFSEQLMYSKRLGIAGTVDCVGYYNGKLSVIDFKSSKKLKNKEDIINYYIQCTIYSLMFAELYGKNIEQCVILMSCDDGNVGEYIFNPRICYPDLKKMVTFYANEKQKLQGN